MNDYTQKIRDRYREFATVPVADITRTTYAEYTKILADLGWLLDVIDTFDEQTIVSVERWLDRTPAYKSVWVDRPYIEKIETLIAYIRRVK